MKLEPGWLMRTLELNQIYFMYNNRRYNESYKPKATPQEAKKLAKMMRERYKEWTGLDL